MMKKPRNWSLKIYLISVLENKKLVMKKLQSLPIVILHYITNDK